MVIYMKLLVATGNKDKLAEFKRILLPLGIDVLAPADVGAALDIEETGTTFGENSKQKAMALYKKGEYGVIADDSGLCVEALDGRPGVFSARYMGEETPHSEKIKGILRELEGVPEQKRTAWFACAICCVLPTGEVLECEERCMGSIALESRGDGGFGYDPIFLVDNVSFGELSPQRKDELSHRGKALRKIAKMLEKHIN